MQAATLTDMPPPSHREKDEIDEMEMAGLSDLEKEGSFRSRFSAKPPSLQARTTAGDGPVGLEMVRVNPMLDQVP